MIKQHSTFISAAILATGAAFAQTPIITYDAASLTSGTAVGQTWTPTGTGVVAANSTAFASGTVVDTSGSSSFFNQAVVGGNSSNDITLIPSNAVDFTYEFWLRPTDLLGDHNLFEVGGFTTGTALTISGADLQFTIREGGVLIDTLSSTLGALPTDFIQVVGVVDATNDVMSLFVNGAQVDTGSVTFASTVGGNAGNFGGTDTNISRPDVFANPHADYDGELALARFYDSALTGTQINSLYTAVVPEPGTFALVSGLIGLGAVMLRRRN